MTPCELDLAYKCKYIPYLTSLKKKNKGKILIVLTGFSKGKHPVNEMVKMAGGRSAAKSVPLLYG